MNGIAAGGIIVGGGLAYLTIIGVMHWIFVDRRVLDGTDEEIWMAAIFWPLFGTAILIRTIFEGFPVWISEKLSHRSRVKKLPKASVVK